MPLAVIWMVVQRRVLVWVEVRTVHTVHIESIQIIWKVMYKDQFMWSNMLTFYYSCGISMLESTWGWTLVHDRNWVTDTIRWNRTKQSCYCKQRTVKLITKLNAEWVNSFKKLYNTAGLLLFSLLMWKQAVSIPMSVCVQLEHGIHEHLYIFAKLLKPTSPGPTENCT